MCKNVTKSLYIEIYCGIIISLLNIRRKTFMSGKFVIKLDKSGQYRFNLKAGNGEIIATSEAYKSKAGCKNGIESVMKNAPTAKVVDETE